MATNLDISSHPAYEQTELTLDIPVIKVKTPIVGVEFKDGNWDVSWLQDLGVGEYIFVINSGYRYTYQVVSNAFVSPHDASVMKHEDKSFLTLITCDTYAETTGIYLRRVVVRAALIDVRSIIK